MNRSSVFFIILFVVLSMSTAVFYQRAQFSDSFSTQAKNMVREIASVSSEVSEEIKNCQCVPSGKGIAPYLTEEKENCQPGSLAYQKEFEKMPPLFRQRRASSPAEFPRLCVVRLLNKSLQPPWLNEKKCASQVPLCVTDEYVNVVYNFYADVFSCFDLPQKETLPWFLVNGGFHLNSKNGVSGLELTKAEAEKYFASALRKIASTDEGSCQRLLPYARKIKLDFKNDCFQISPPENPLLSFLIFAEKYSDSRKQMTSFLAAQKKPGYSYDDEEHLLQMLTLQSLAGASKNDFIDKMNQAVKELNRDFKEGTCVSDSFPSL